MEDPTKVTQDAAHLRWAAEKLQGQLDQQEDLQQRLERKAIAAATWPLVAIVAVAGIFPSAAVDTTWRTVIASIVLVTAVLGYVAVLVNRGAAMNVLNYYDDKDEKWDSYDVPTATRVTINALQSSILKRREELKVKAMRTMVTQTAIPKTR